MEAKLTVGVRYCGGCNSRYDRVAVVKKLQSLLPNVRFVNAASHERYDAAIVVSGCETACAERSDLNVSSAKIYDIHEWRDVIPVRNKIRELSEREKGISLSLEEVKNILPHRSPMLFIDSVSELKPGEEIEARFHVREDLPEFAGHFPGNAIFPGVHTLESMAQAADIMLMTLPRHAGKVPLFVKADSVSFRRKILPGDEIVIKAYLVEELRAMGWNKCKCQVIVSSSAAADAVIVIAMAEK